MEKYEQILSYLDKTSKILVSWLEKALPKLSPNWWENNVVAKLSDAQRDRVRNKNITSLSGLDLAALLRVFDYNWNGLSPKHKLYYEDNHLLKEMYKIRNRWAHKPMDGYSLEAVHRDFDTIQLFLRLIDADIKIILELKKIKLDIMKEISNGNFKKPDSSVNKNKERDVKGKSTSQRMTGKYILRMEKGDTITALDFYTLIVNSKKPDSENWEEGYIINNTPQKGINWIGNDNNPLAVIIKSIDGKYAEDCKGKEYAFEAEKGIVNKKIKANQVLINQPKYNYPILYFVKKGKEFTLIGKYSVDKVLNTSVTLVPYEVLQKNK